MNEGNLEGARNTKRKGADKIKPHGPKRPRVGTTRGLKDRISNLEEHRIHLDNTINNLTALVIGLSKEAQRISQMFPPPALENAEEGGDSDSEAVLNVNEDEANKQEEDEC